MKSTRIRAGSSLAACVFVLGAGGELPAQGGLMWRQLSPANSPSPRAGHDMVYDAARGRIVLFGGWNRSGVMSDTWEWDGVDWRQATPANSPPARARHSMAYDSARQRVVLFGGATDGWPPPPLGDTWEWDGVNWTQAMPVQSPPDRLYPSLAYDSARQRVLLFGGLPAHGLNLTDTWEWDGVSWIQATPSQVPTRQAGPDMVYDSARQRVVLFGEDLTWEWDGADWTQLFPTQVPGVREHHAMAFDPARRRTVLFGGVRFGAVDGTWEWDGVNWTRAIPSQRPSARAFHSMVYDPSRGSVLLFGGQFLSFQGDTWECRSVSPAGFTPIGSGCGGSAGLAILDVAPLSLPWTGDRYSIELSNLPPGNMTFMVTGLSNTFWVGALIRLPAPLVSWGMPGCTAYTDVVHSELLTNTTGAAIWTKMVPSDARLIGLAFYNQGFIIDQGVNAMGAVVSNAGKSVIGMR